MDFLSQLDSSLLLAINGWHSAWADQFMYAYSSKWVWIPMYVSLVYFIFRNLHWRTALGCAVAVALTIVVCRSSLFASHPSGGGAFTPVLS